MTQVFNPGDYTLVIGTFADDSHNVGRSLLALALLEEGYNVVDLKLHNELHDFLQAARCGHAILISSLNGHASGLMETDFKKNIQAFERENGKRLWYIGGNLCINADAEIVRAQFHNLGFTEAYVKPKDFDLETFLVRLRKDLQYLGDVKLQRERIDTKVSVLIKPNDRKLILDEYASGVGSFEDTIACQRSITIRFASVLQKAKLDGTTLIHPRCGVSSVTAQADLFRQLKGSGADCLSVQVDSSTRHHQFKNVEGFLQSGKEMNGYPAINFGVLQNRRLVKEFPDVPLQVRHGSYDGRLLAEVGFASGFTAIEGGAICYNVPYFSNVPLRDSILTWKYVDKLSGMLTQAGMAIDREFFGTLTATLIEPSLAIAVNILEALLAAEQGVRFLSLGYAEQGNREQDIAAIRSLEKLTKEYLVRFGFHDVQTSTVFHSYMAAFPSNKTLAGQIITESAVTARLAGATRIMTKSPVECSNVPQQHANIQGIELTKQGFETRGYYDEQKVVREEMMIEATVKNIIESVLIAGEGDVTNGVIKGFEMGYLDIPFAPSIYNAGKVKTLRDKDGAIRYYDPGNMVIPHDVLHEHRRLLEGRNGKFFSMVKDDLTRVFLNEIKGWPLSEYYNNKTTQYGYQPATLDAADL